MIEALATTAALAATAAAGYFSMAPRSQTFGATFIGTPGKGKKLALTYDDGPNGSQTTQLLDVLAAHGVKATFFLIGKYVREQPQVVQRLAFEGHAVGNHTFHHPNLIFSTAAELRQEMEDCERALADAGVKLGEGGARKLFRPPFGARRPKTLRVLRQLGYVPVNWSVTCYDWKATTAARVEAHALRQVRGGDVILMHDGSHRKPGADRRHTVEATALLIRRYKEEGYEFVTVPEWLAAEELGAEELGAKFPDP